jgi:hypothetical protein
MPLPPLDSYIDLPYDQFLSQRESARLAEKAAAFKHANGCPVFGRVLGYLYLTWAVGPPMKVGPVISLETHCGQLSARLLSNPSQDVFFGLVEKVEVKPE